MTDLVALNAALDRLAPVYGFPWHAKQLVALRESPDVLCIPAGNRGGKTEVAAGIVGRLVRREGPIYNRLKKGMPLQLDSTVNYALGTSELQLSAGLALDRLLWAWLSQSADRAEGRQAFREGRPPAFEGR